MALQYCTFFLPLHQRITEPLQDTFGFSFVSGVPVTTEATERLCERISYIRETQCLFLFWFWQRDPY